MALLRGRVLHVARHGGSLGDPRQARRRAQGAARGAGRDRGARLLERGSSSTAPCASADSAGTDAPESASAARMVPACATTRPATARLLTVASADRVRARCSAIDSPPGKRNEGSPADEGGVQVGALVGKLRDPPALPVAAIGFHELIEHDRVDTQGPLPRPPLFRARAAAARPRPPRSRRPAGVRRAPRPGRPPPGLSGGSRRPRIRPSAFSSVSPCRASQKDTGGTLGYPPAARVRPLVRWRHGLLGIVGWAHDRAKRPSRGDVQARRPSRRSPLRRATRSTSQPPHRACRRGRSKRCSARQWRRRAVRGGSWAWEAQGMPAGPRGARPGELATAPARGRPHTPARSRIWSRRCQ